MLEVDGEPLDTQGVQTDSQVEEESVSSGGSSVASDYAPAQGHKVYASLLSGYSIGQ